MLTTALRASASPLAAARAHASASTSSIPRLASRLPPRARRPAPSLRHVRALATGRPDEEAEKSWGEIASEFSWRRRAEKRRG